MRRIFYVLSLLHCRFWLSNSSIYCNCIDFRMKKWQKYEEMYASYKCFSGVRKSHWHELLYKLCNNKKNIFFKNSEKFQSVGNMKTHLQQTIRYEKGVLYHQCDSQLKSIHQTNQCVWTYLCAASNNNGNSQ